MSTIKLVQKPAPNERNFPQGDHLSVLVATIMLAYTLAKFVNIPPQLIPIEMAGISLPIIFQADTIVALLVAGMMATGADWILRGHPGLANRSTAPHWLLPALTAWIISLPLNALPFNGLWWLAFSGGILLVVLVLIAEYIALDPADARQPVAAAGLSGLAYTLFLILGISVASIDLRLYLRLPAVLLGGALVSVRVLQLNTRQWKWAMASVSGLVITQLAAGLHYHPITPVSYGLALLGPVYAINTFLTNYQENQPLRGAVLLPGVILAAVWVLAFFVG
jgi:hypothetical protein